MADSLAELEMRRADLLAQIHNFPTSALARLPRPSLAKGAAAIPNVTAITRANPADDPWTGTSLAAETHFLLPRKAISSKAFAFN